MAFFTLALFSPTADVRRAGAIGFCLALAAVIRLQYGPALLFIAVVFLFALPQQRRLPYFIGGLSAVLLWGIVDTVVLGYPYASIINYGRIYIFPPPEVKAIYDAYYDTFSYIPWYYNWYNIAVTGAGLFPLALLWACVLGRKNWFILIIILILMFLHSAYHNREYSNNFVCILLLIALTSFAESALATKNWPKTAVLIPLTIAVAYLPSYHFFTRSPTFGISRYLASQANVCAVLWQKFNIYDSGGYYLFHHRAPVYYKALPDHAAILKLAQKTPDEFVSHIVDYQGETDFQPIDYENFDLVHAIDGKWFVYKNRNPQNIAPLPGYTYDNFAFSVIEDKLLELGAIKEKPPLTPFIPSDKQC